MQRLSGAGGLPRGGGVTREFTDEESESVRQTAGLQHKGSASEHHSALYHKGDDF